MDKEFKINTGKVMPEIQISNLGGPSGAKVETRARRKTKQMRMKELRDATKDKFERMRERARLAVKKTETNEAPQ